VVSHRFLVPVIAGSNPAVPEFICHERLEMEQKTLNAESRVELRKGASRRLRRSGKIPAILYGHSGTAPITIDAHEFSQTFKQMSENTIINLQIGKQAYDVLLKDFQEDIIKGSITHIDFYEIERGKVLRTNIPVHTNGTPIGVREGGILEVLLHSIEVECLPRDIPESFEVDVSALDVGDSVHITDIELPESVKFLVSEEAVVVSVIAPRAIEEVEVDEELEEGEMLEGEEGEAGEGEAGEGSEEETDKEE
jgi:large subunit ribosomal protein L25